MGNAYWYVSNNNNIKGDKKMTEISSVGTIFDAVWQLLNTEIQLFTGYSITIWGVMCLMILITIVLRLFVGK